MEFSKGQIRKPTIFPRKPATVKNDMAVPADRIAQAEIRQILGGRGIQAKLTIGTPNDKYEQEADCVADDVMRMQERDVQRMESPEEEPEEEVQRTPLTNQSPPQIQRLCSECEDEIQRVAEDQDENELVQSKSQSASPDIAPSVAADIHSIQGGGQSLSASERSYYEPRFGRDFGQTRIHTDSRANTLARAVNARAFTLGHNIVFGAGEYQPKSKEGKRLMGHELTHVVQQARSPSLAGNTIRRKQIGRVHDESTDPHFIYKLDSTMYTFSQLGKYYGISSKNIEKANPGTSPTKLRSGQEIKVPAPHPPAAGSQPSGAGHSSIVKNTANKPVIVRWGSGTGASKVGVIKRGESVFTFTLGVDIPLPSVNNQAKGIVDEMQQRSLIAGGIMLFGHIPVANIRSTTATVTASDEGLLARMIWGEQRNQGRNAMVAAAWVARNRYDSGWGSYTQIITPGQFHGLAAPADVVGLTGADLRMWNLAQQIANDVVNSIIADPTGGVVYFGNGASVRRRMVACAAGNSAFTWSQITGINFYYSNGDYTSAACTIP